MWLRENHPAFVCHEAYGKFCPGVDASLKADARISGYDDRDLVEHLYRREMYASKIFK
jgi:hypothetical protein